MHLLYKGCGGFIAYTVTEDKSIQNTLLQIREYYDIVHDIKVP